MTKEKILIIDDDDSIRWVLEKATARAGIDSLVRASAEDIEAVLAEYRPHAIISDIRMPGLDGMQLLAEVQKSHPELPVIIMTAHSDLETAVAAFKGGAFEYLPKPFDIEEALRLIKRAIKESHSDTDTANLEGELPETEMLGESPLMQKLFVAIGRLSRSQATVLIHGETGTGKELVAHALHKHSLREAKPFIALNMAAIPRDLVESELFGHEKGAFTGASQHRRGRFEQADKGTLFLDEIGDMPLEIQTRLLRVLEDGVFYRVGGHEPIKVNVRVVAATHQDLIERVKAGDFREDLYHRLNVIRLELPALRERASDIPLLATHFLNQAIEELNIGTKRLTNSVLKKMQTYAWPGNVRQLENCCRWLAVMSSGQDIDAADLPDEITGAQQTEAGSWLEQLRVAVVEEISRGNDDIMVKLQSQFEQVLIEQAMQATSGHKQKSARLLGWGRNTLTRKLKQYNEQPE